HRCHGLAGRLLPQVDLPDGELGARTAVALAARAREIRGIDAGAKIAGRVDVVDPVAGGAICHRLAAGPGFQAVEAVGEGGHAVGGQVVARVQTLVPVAAAAGDCGDATG